MWSVFMTSLILNPKRDNNNDPSLLSWCHLVYILYLSSQNTGQQENDEWSQYPDGDDPRHNLEIMHILVSVKRFWTLLFCSLQVKQHMWYSTYQTKLWIEKNVHRGNQTCLGCGKIVMEMWVTIATVIVMGGPYKWLTSGMMVGGEILTWKCWHTDLIKKQIEGIMDCKMANNYLKLTIQSQHCIE